MKINGMRCNQCGKEQYNNPFMVGDYLPKGWFSLMVSGGELGEHFCSRECLKKMVLSDAHLTVPQDPREGKGG